MQDCCCFTSTKSIGTAEELSELKNPKISLIFDRRMWLKLMGILLSSEKAPKE